MSAGDIDVPMVATPPTIPHSTSSSTSTVTAQLPRPHLPDYYAIPSPTSHSFYTPLTAVQIAELRSILPNDSDNYTPVLKEYLVPRGGKTMPELTTTSGLMVANVTVSVPASLVTVVPAAAAAAAAAMVADSSESESARKAPKLDERGTPTASAATVASAESTVATSVETNDAAMGSCDATGVSSTATAASAAATGAAVDESKEDSSSNGPNSKKRKRGQNKPSEREIFKDQPQVRLCRATSLGEACKWIERCKFSHDLAAYLAHVKGPDHAGPCPIFARYGSCPYGFQCRFSTHGHDPSLKPTNPPPATHPHALELNNPSKDVLNSYASAGNHGKKAEARFPRSTAFMHKFERWKKMYDKLRDQKQKEKENAQRERNKAMRAAATATTTTIATAAPTPAPSSNVTAPTAAVASAAMDTSIDNATAVSSTPAPSSVAPILSSECDPSISATILPPTFPPLTLEQEIEVAALKALYTPAFPVKVDPFQIVTDQYTDWSSGLILVDIERKPFDFRDKLYLAPLTTVGNLPFRLVCKDFGCDVTIGEMALCQSLSRGSGSEWALVRRHKRENHFGVQIAAAFADQVTRACEAIQNECVVDFVDLNIGCPIDPVTRQGMGSALMQRKRSKNLEPMLRAMTSILDCPATIKMRMGWSGTELTCMDLLPIVNRCGMAAVTIHGRTRQQRYTKAADRDFVKQAATYAKEKCNGLPVIANGDVYTFEDYESLINPASDLATTMIARGALVKPWLFTEIRERRHWDISASERFDMLRTFVTNGFDHWGTDTKGIENTRRYLLEWLSFLHRYVPVGLLETHQVGIQMKPPAFYARSDLEQLLSSPDVKDWIRISELLIGPVPEGFKFTPKHKSSTNSEEGGG